MLLALQLLLSWKYDPYYKLVKPCLWVTLYYQSVKPVSSHCAAHFSFFKVTPIFSFLRNSHEGLKSSGWSRGEMLDIPLQWYSAAVLMQEAHTHTPNKWTGCHHASCEPPRPMWSGVQKVKKWGWMPHLAPAARANTAQRTKSIWKSLKTAHITFSVFFSWQSHTIPYFSFPCSRPSSTHLPCSCSLSLIKELLFHIVIVSQENINPITKQMAKLKPLWLQHKRIIQITNLPVNRHSLLRYLLGSRPKPAYFGYVYKHFLNPHWQGCLWYNSAIYIIIYPTNLVRQHNQWNKRCKIPLTF